MSGAITNVAVVHSNRLFREALVRALSTVEWLSIIIDVSAIDHVSSIALNTEGGLFLVEASVPLHNCLYKASDIRTIAPGSKTIMLGVPDDDEAVLACIEIAGASGYVLHDASWATLIATMKSVLIGEALCSPRVANLAFSRVSTLSRLSGMSRGIQAKPLTHREKNIIGCIERGLSNKEIASQLGIEVSTVKNHVHNILDKLHARNRHAAVEYVKEQALTLISF